MDGLPSPPQAAAVTFRHPDLRTPFVRDAFITAAVRTPVARAAGALAEVRPDDLAAVAIRGLVERGRLPDPLRPYVSRLFGLTIDPHRLHQIRQERRPDSRYAALDTCRREVKQVEALFQRYRIPSVNASATSVEEIATTVMQRSGLLRQAL